MTVYRTVYLARHLNENPEVIPGTFGTGPIIGTNPLDVEDGATGYVMADWESPSLHQNQVTFRLQHDGISPVRAGPITGMFIDVAYEVTTTGLVGPSVIITNTALPLQRPSGSDDSQFPTWTRIEKPMVMPFDPADWEDADNTAHPWRIASSSAGTFGSYMSVRVTYLRIIVEWQGGARLRQRLRDDLRARNTSSRQRGLRAKGYY